MLTGELNVKAIEIVSDVGDLVDYKLLPNNRVLGPRFGKQFGAVRKALSGLDAADVAAQLQTAGQITLDVAGEAVTLTADEIIVNTEARGDDAVASDKGVTVAVDTVITPELEQEGYARDLVRNINEARRSGGFDISDRVDVTYSASGKLQVAFLAFADFIRAETLAESLSAGGSAPHTFTATIGGEEVAIGLSKA